MDFIKKIGVLCFNAIIRPLLLIISDLSAGLGGLIRKPFQDLAGAWSRSRASGPGKVSAKPTRRFFEILLWPLSLILAVASVALRILISPAELLVGLIGGNRSHIFWALPSVLCLVAAISIAAFNGYFDDWLSPNRRSGDLRNKALASFSTGDYESAAQWYGELMDASSTPIDSDRLNWAISLARAGKQDAASEVFEDLAPGPGGLPGYPAAHQTLALNIASQLESPPNPLHLKSLRWHLECSEDTRSPEINRVWAQYYLSVNDQNSALRHLKLAAQVQPEYMVVVAEIYRTMGNDLAQDEALRIAADLFENKVEQEPLDIQARTTYAKILFDLKQYDLAEQILLAGRKLENGDELRTACARFYLSLYQLHNGSVDQNETPLNSDFEMLRKSLEQDINHIATYQELIALYQSAKNEGNQNSIVQMLQENLEKDESAALCHLSLSNVLWMENKLEESQSHMERAFELNPEFSIVANNLAWILAHAEPPELERAFEIANQVVERNPADGRFRDTLATILMKQEKYAQALTEFQKAIATVDDPKDVHGKMASIYRTLNKTELADHHQEQADAN
jgi:tetratricopeptide (TPR) repeat protein